MRTITRTKWLAIQAFLLIVCLFFGQLGKGFLHNRHDFHESFSVTPLDHEAVLLAHGEHCKVCAIDLFHQFVGTAATFVSTPEVVQIEYVPTAVDFPFLPKLALRGRAPPVA